jgi:hypothetical protein
MLGEHKKSDYITRLIDIEYERSAECPNWKMKKAL